jgi:hypothetical protein
VTTEQLSAGRQWVQGRLATHAGDSAAEAVANGVEAALVLAIAGTTLVLLYGRSCGGRSRCPADSARSQAGCHTNRLRPRQRGGGRNRQLSLTCKVSNH